MKYLIRQKQRIIGPLEENEIGILFIEGYLNGREKFSFSEDQNFQEIRHFPALVEVFKKIIANKIQIEDLEKTSSKLIKDLLSKRSDYKKEVYDKEIKKRIEEIKGQAQDKSFKEFTYKSAEEKVFDDTVDPIEESLLKLNLLQSLDNEDTSSNNEIDNQEDLDKTVIQKKVKDSKNDSTRVIKRPGPDEIEKTKILTRDVVKDISEVEINNLPEISPEDKTEYANIYELMPVLKEEISESESKESELIEKQVPQTAKKKEKRKPLLIFVMILVILFLVFDEEGEQDIGPVYAEIIFPNIYEYANKTKSEEKLADGIELYKNSDYLSKIKAASYFRESLELKYKNNPALGFLILSYAELLPFTRNKKKSSKVLFEIIRIGRPNIYKDINIAMGTAIFYLFNGKTEAAKNTLENFLRVNKKSDIKFLSLYLKVLTKGGYLVDALKAKEKLEKLGSNTIDTYLSLNDYYFLNQEYVEAKKSLKKGYLEFPRSVPLLIAYGEILIQEQEWENLKNVLKALEILKKGNAAKYYAKFLEMTGIYLGSQGEVKKAAKFLTQSLKVYEDEALRRKLASLDLSKDDFTNDLIENSKVIDLINQARALAREKNYRDAFLTVDKAIAIDPYNLEAKLTLVNIQTEQGFYKRALIEIEKLYKKNSKNIKVNLAYINTLIKAFKLEEANKVLIGLQSTKIKVLSEFDIALGRFYYKKKDYYNSINFYRKAIKKDPLNDIAQYELALVFTEMRKYKNAQERINAALEIVPTSIKYQILYADILYERDSLDVALGYLRDLKKDYPGNPQILSSIAILYFRSGRIIEFEELKKEIETSYIIDRRFYEFLISNAIAEDKKDEVIKFSRELIKVDPGNLENRLLLAVYLFDKNQYQRSLEELEKLSERLNSYPKLNYYFSKIFLEQNDMERALEFANKEIELNPHHEWGFIAKGEVLLKKKKFVLAQRQLEEALKRNKKNIQALKTLAQVRYGQNFIDDAFGLYTRALRINKSDPEIHKMLGYIYKSKGQRTLAYESFRVYLDLDEFAQDKNKIESLMEQLR